jgi:hypothetical protein
MYSNNKLIRDVADIAAQIMSGQQKVDEKLHPNQQKLDVHEPEKDELTADDFKKLRAGKKAPEVKKEEVGLDEVSLKTATSAYVKRMGDDGPNEKSSIAKATKTMDLIAKKHGVRGVARATKTADDKYGLNDPVHNPRKAFVKQTMANVKKEEVELTKEEAEMLASLSQEEFNSLTEEEQDLFIEYFQPLDEISTGAAKNYLKKAVPSSSKLNQKSAKPGEDKASESDYMDMDAPYETKEFQKFSKRRTGIRKAITKLASAHPDNKKLATTARQAFNKIHNANYRIGMDGAKNTPNDVKHVKQQHSIIHKAVNAMKEAAEQIVEYKSTGGVYKHKGTYGTEKSLEAGYTDYDKENELAKKNLKDKKPKKYGARQNFVRSTRVNESFTSILASYKENGLKGISEMFATEQASQEEYEKEIEKAKAKSQGKDKAEVAKASVQAVKSEQTHTKIEVIDMSDPYNIQKREIDLEEREMTDAEMEKKEEIVKSMKKGMKGFKERYGERAKEVMYATATKQAMKD